MRKYVPARVPPAYRRPVASVAPVLAGPAGDADSSDPDGAFETAAQAAVVDLAQAAEQADAAARMSDELDGGAAAADEGDQTMFFTTRRRKVQNPVTAYLNVRSAYHLKCPWLTSCLHAITESRCEARAACSRIRLGAVQSRQ